MTWMNINVRKMVIIMLRVVGKVCKVLEFIFIVFCYAMTVCYLVDTHNESALVLSVIVMACLSILVRVIKYRVDNSHYDKYK